MKNIKDNKEEIKEIKLKKIIIDLFPEDTDTESSSYDTDTDTENVFKKRKKQKSIFKKKKEPYVGDLNETNFKDLKKYKMYLKILSVPYVFVDFKKIHLKIKDFNDVSDYQIYINNWANALRWLWKTDADVNKVKVIQKEATSVRIKKIKHK